jgi:hypothetical protein
MRHFVILGHLFGAGLPAGWLGQSERRNRVAEQWDAADASDAPVNRRERKKLGHRSAFVRVAEQSLIQRDSSLGALSIDLASAPLCPSHPSCVGHEGGPGRTTTDAPQDRESAHRKIGVVAFGQI